MIGLSLCKHVGLTVGRAALITWQHRVEEDLEHFRLDTRERDLRAVVELRSEEGREVAETLKEFEMLTPV